MTASAVTALEVSEAPLAAVPASIDYRTDPSRYRHWSLAFDGVVATLSMNVDENAGLKPGYKLKLNSYDLGVDIELHDAINRVRFEHPEVRTVVMTSTRDRARRFAPDGRDRRQRSNG